MRPCVLLLSRDPSMMKMTMMNQNVSYISGPFERPVPNFLDLHNYK